MNFAQNKFVGRLIFIAVFLVFCNAVKADDSCDLINLFEKCKYPLSSDKTAAISDIFNELRGDTLMIHFEEDMYTRLFQKEQPDTVWKKRPKKDPKEGKHYTLQPYYKGVVYNGRLFTPCSAVNDIPFGLLSVSIEKMPIFEHGIRKISDMVVLKLVDLDSLEVFNMVLNSGSKVNFTISSTRLNREFSQLKGKRFYLKKDNRVYEPVALADASYRVNITGNTNDKEYVRPELFLKLLSENSQYIEYTPSSYCHRFGSENYLISEQRYLDEYAPRSIDSKIDFELAQADSILPFSFRYILGVPKEWARMSQSIDPTELPNGTWTSNSNNAPVDMMFVAGILNVQGRKFYKMAYNGKAFLWRQIR